MAESAVDSALAIQAVAPLNGDAADTVRRIENRLWDYLDEGCNEAGTGCEVLAIRHNTNKSAGLAFLDPLDRAEADRSRRNEPVVEMFQQKGGSECRYDRLAGAGVGTADELCTFEEELGLMCHESGADPDSCLNECDPDNPNTGRNEVLGEDGEWISGPAPC